MLKTYFYQVFLLAALSVGVFLAVGFALATNEPNITFPIPELGNCRDKQACKTYCNEPENIQVCVAFAKEHKLLNKQEIERGEKFAKIAAQAGPGGCRGQEACHAYCEDIGHVEECVAFAENTDL